MSWFGNAASLEDVANQMQRQQQQGAAEGGDVGEGQQGAGGILVAPGVRFSDKLWTRLGGQLQDSEKQKRREKLTGSTAFPDIPSSLFDNTFRRDAVWKQRELRLRKGYAEHLESLTLQRDQDKETLQDKILDQVTGVYKLTEDEAMEKLSKHTIELQQRANRLRPKEAPCFSERSAVLDCYNGNSANPLVCSSLVSAMEKCALLARQEAVKRLAPSS